MVKPYIVPTKELTEFLARAEADGCHMHSDPVPHTTEITVDPVTGKGKHVVLSWLVVVKGPTVGPRSEDEIAALGGIGR